MRRAIILAILMIALSILVLSSNSVSETAERLAGDVKLIAGEIPEIISTIKADGKRTEARGREKLEPDSPDTGIFTDYHTEVIETIYNSKTKRNTLASLGEYALEITDEEPVTDVSGLTEIGWPEDLKAETFLGILEEHGIGATVEYVPNPAPAGDIIAIRFAGCSGDALYIEPGSEAVLIASAEKPAERVKDGRLVYITFDDGPTKNGTGEVLDVLDEFGVKAAFFTLGSSVDLYPSSAKAIADRGHHLGCHSYSHVYKDIYSSSWAMGQEISRWEEAVENAGIDTGDDLLFRFPGGSVNSYMNEYLRLEMISVIEDRGYRIFDWNVLTNDAVLFTAPEGTGNYEFIKETFEETLDTCLAAYGEDEPVIILMHETVRETQNQLRWILEYLIDRGYSFGDLSELDSWTFE